MARAGVLSAYVEIVLASGDHPAARDAADQLAAVSTELQTPLVTASSRYASGAVLLAEGDARAAVDALRDAWTTWQEIGVPYEAARVRVLLGQAFRVLGDEDTAAMELDAALSAFRRLAAAPDVARVEVVARVRSPRRTRADSARGGGARPRRDRPDQPGDRRRPLPEREDRRPPCEQHLHQARAVVPVGGHGVRVRARPHLARTPDRPYTERTISMSLGMGASPDAAGPFARLTSPA